MRFSRDQVRTFRRTGKLVFTVHTDVEVKDGELQITPCDFTTGDKRGRGATTVSIRTQKGGEVIGYGQVIDVTENNLAWDVTVKRHDEPFKVRLLASASVRGYTDEPALALPEEPEAVDEETQERITQEVKAKNAQIKRDRIREMRAGIDAAAAGLSPTDMDRLDRKDLERIEFYMSRIEQRASDTP